MTDYVMFGQNALLGDLIDIIHQDGRLCKIVLNMETTTKPRRMTFEDRLSMSVPYHVPVIKIEKFKPEPGEIYLFGFFGNKIEPLLNRLIKEFNIDQNKFCSMFHRTAIIPDSTKCGKGCIFNSGCILGSHVTLGRHCFINRGATIGHDTTLGDVVTISPGANIASNTYIKYGAYIGMGANILEDLIIGENSIVAAGAVVINDIPDNVMVAGVPAIIKHRT